MKLQGREAGEVMNVQMNTLVPGNGHLHQVSLFGYASRGIPGIEIVGQGKHARVIKEKLIYLSRVSNKIFPAKRFVLCAESSSDLAALSIEDIRYLELPMLLMLWTLSENLSLHQLSDCFSSGKISTNGKIECLKLTTSQWLNLNEYLQVDDEIVIKVIGPKEETYHPEVYHLPLEEIISSTRGEKKKLNR